MGVKINNYTSVLVCSIAWLQILPKRRKTLNTINPYHKPESCISPISSREQSSDTRGRGRCRGTCNSSLGP